MELAKPSGTADAAINQGINALRGIFGRQIKRAGILRGLVGAGDIEPHGQA